MVCQSACRVAPPSSRTQQVVSLLIRVALAAALLGGIATVRADDIPDVVAAIRAEATRANLDPGGRPLPLAATWQRGDIDGTYTPDVQRLLIEQGHYLLPNIPMPNPDQNANTRWKSLLETYAQWNIPIAIRGGNWHLDAFGNSTWRNKPPEENPFVLRADGTIDVSAGLDALGPMDAWYQGGQNLISSQYDGYQQWYPDPPKVLFISNNEAALGGSDKRFVDAYGPKDSHSIDFINHVIGGGRAERFGEMIQGMKDALTEDDWKNNSTFIGYKNFGPSLYTRVQRWQNSSNAGDAVTELDAFGNPVSFDAQIDHSWMGWDGGSPPYYAHDWSRITDFHIFSVQVEAMNWVFMKNHTEQQNPDFWFELSVWDGGTTKYNRYERDFGQTYTPERYAGMINYGMWLLQPRVVREFRSHADPVYENRPEYFEALMGAVDQVHENAILRRFWRQSELVANLTQDHPYGDQNPGHWGGAGPELEAFKDELRWFLLQADVNPQVLVWNPNHDHEIKVFSLARVRGEIGAREWLLYAHSPVMDREDVTITIPDYMDVTVDVSVAGSFYLIDEATGSITFIPEPTALGLLAVGSLLLLRRHRLA